ncbi:MAG: hypothetical protein K1X31_14630 [Gemmatimonadaceae bacterium]|nr:hypothetical protein [Gemmatimonadaceae bacterium]
MSSEAFRGTRLLWAACALTALAAGVVRAQAAVQAPEAEVSRRLWVEVGVGGAAARLTCDVCSPARDVGALGSLAVGAYASPRARLGIEATAWTYANDGVREHLDGLALIGAIHPSARRPAVYLQGGIGWTAYRADTFRWRAARLSLGVGYDVPITGRWVVGNLVSLDGSGFGTLRSSGSATLRNVGLSTVRISAQVRRR